jgi:Domain of unknown function (DUF4338)
LTASKIVNLAARPATLKRRLRRHLQALGFERSWDGSLHLADTGKDVIRALHQAQRNDRLVANKSFIARALPRLKCHFADGSDINANRVQPALQRISADTWESDLFRLASLTWAVPVSNGFGRRLRYLVWDSYNGKLIGLIAIGDPVFNLAVRDRLIGWTSSDRGERLVNLMDAYVLGAVPPYNTILGGKLIAALVRSRDIYDDFSRTYGGTTGIISGKEKQARLLAVTTSSSLGRSSVYNRLRLDGADYLTSIGYTGGWGHFHIPDDLFLDLRAYLREIEHPYADLNRFGQGPNWRLRTTRAALAALGLNEHTLRHGIQREVFLATLADNALKILRTGKGKPDLSTLLGASDVGALAVERWLQGRALRRPEYLTWKASGIESLLHDKSNIVALARTG